MLKKLEVIAVVILIVMLITVFITMAVVYFLKTDIPPKNPVINNISIDKLFTQEDKEIHKLKLPSIFSDNMVLQRNNNVLIWGTANPNTKVSVSVNNNIKETTSNTDGLWSIILADLPAGGPYELKVLSGSESIELKNVFIGEVWYCGGQSNMAFSVNDADITNKQALTELQDSKIFLYQLPKKISLENQSSMAVNASWVNATDPSYMKFSDLCLLYGKSLSDKLHVPIGLVDASYNATYIESWIDKSALTSIDSYKTYIDSIYSNENIGNSNTFIKSCNQKMIPGGNYNSMVYPVINYTYGGYIWYQGENNVKNASNYDELLKLLIASYRDKGASKKVVSDFYVIQLPSFDEPGNKDSWAILRNKQSEVTNEIERTFLVTNTDLSDPKVLHPTDKRELSNRLVHRVLYNTYGISDDSYSAKFSSSEVVGNKIKVTFDTAEDTILIRSTSTGFQIAGSDLKYYDADVQSLSKNQLLVSSSKVANPLYVRYNWTNITNNSLVLENSNTPIVPFKTDSVSEKDVLSLDSIVCK